MGIPCVISLVPPYDRDLSQFKHFIPSKNDFNSWLSSFEAVISNDINREISKDAFDFVRGNYGVEYNVLTLKRVLTDLH